MFGLYEFTIGLDANTEESCRSYINLQYFNSKYERSDFNKIHAESCKKMNGSEKLEFKTKEWEVWKIIV